jgi:phosphoribosylformylglycinamidine (FGAM) synthase-like amidotransferase family enzyme
MHNTLSNLAGLKTKMMWHSDADLSEVDGVVIPGGFAHGDYLSAQVQSLASVQ